MEREAGTFFIGEQLDSSTNERSGSPITIKSSDLTTHGVIVGMTGSGKTGLGVVVLEEARTSGIPILAIDPKGDLGNLCLTFPEFDAESFTPWVDPAEAGRKNISVDDLAAETAQTWKEGLASWGLGSEDVAALQTPQPTIYTPGSDAGIPINVLGRLQAPVEKDPTALRTEIESTVTALLTLINIESDPLSGREHILLSNLIAKAWENDTDLDLPILVSQIQDPPIRKLGVLELDTFFPEKDRQALALKLNGLLASPSFAPWAEGVPLDIERMLWDEQGIPQTAIVSLNHLEETERQFAVTLLLSKVISWMRTQQGTSDLRMLIYIDEVMGYAPPTSQPPTKKPILTLLKQARAFGVGLILSTQNPVDLDYKALSNAGTWLIGRLQTEQDKKRLLDGLQSAAGSTGDTKISDVISALGKRQFVFKSAKSADTPVFSTRWAMSYLAGPFSRPQIQTLMSKKSQEVLTSETQPSAASLPETAEELGDGYSSVAPNVPDSLPVRYTAAAAPWLEQIGADHSSTKVFPVLAARVEMLFDDTQADLREIQEWEAIVPAATDTFDIEQAITVDFDDRDFVVDPPEGVQYALPQFEITASSVKKVSTTLKNSLYTNQTMAIHSNKNFKLWSRPGESIEDFSLRCQEAAASQADIETIKLRDKILTKIKKAEGALAKAEDRLHELEVQEDGSKSNQILDIGVSVLGGLLGGRKRAGSLAASARRMSRSRKSSARVKAKIDTAQNRLEESEETLEELEHELQDSIMEIDSVWTAKASEIEEVSIPLEKTDITIKDLHLVWVPKVLS